MHNGGRINHSSHEDFNIPVSISTNQSPKNTISYFRAWLYGNGLTRVGLKCQIGKKEAHQLVFFNPDHGAKILNEWEKVRFMLY
jgi:hypothetical protein